VSARALEPDTSRLDDLCDRLQRIYSTDPRRFLELGPAWERLKADKAMWETELEQIGPDFVGIVKPHPRLVALYESLRLRALLDLPQMDSPEV
jgi:hypothetical protein